MSYIENTVCCSLNFAYCYRCVVLIFIDSGIYIFVSTFKSASVVDEKFADVVTVSILKVNNNLELGVAFLLVCIVNVVAEAFGNFE